VIITGESGAGKTTALKGLLSQWSGSAFVLDVTNEYGPKKTENGKMIEEGFREADFGGVFSTSLWQKVGQRVRFVTNQESVEAARGEASSIFGHLNYLKNAGKLKLADRV
jgi:GTPase SAR1 family protein